MKSWGLPLWDLLLRRKKPEVSRPPAALQPSRPAAAPRDGERVGERGEQPGGAALRSEPTSQRLLRPRVRAARESTKRRGQVNAPAKPARHRETAAERYDRIAREMLAAHGIRVRKWRSGMSGVAWELKYHDGSVKRMIEAPRPRGPMSMAIFLHEVGHHAIGFNRYRPRCLEEYHAWRFALEQMEAHGLNITEGVRRRVHRSLHYAIGKANRRGLRSLPVELEPYVERPPRTSRRRTPPRRRR